MSVKTTESKRYEVSGRGDIKAFIADLQQIPENAGIVAVDKLSSENQTWVTPEGGREKTAILTWDITFSFSA